MPICIECGNAVTRLYSDYGKDNIVLNKCSRCNNFADKYLEYESIVIFIDLLLLKPQVYRHLLFNRIEYCDTGLPLFYLFRATRPQLLSVWNSLLFLCLMYLQRPVYKLGILITLFDIYIKWFLIEQSCKGISCPWMIISPFTQYFQLLFLSLSELLVYQYTIRGLVWYKYGRKYAIFKYNYVSLALTLASFGKLLLIAMVIWNYELHYTWLLSLLILSCNVEALKDVSYFETIMIIGGGFLAKFLVVLLFTQYFIHYSAILVVT